MSNTLDLSHHRLEKWDLRQATQVLRGTFLKLQNLTKYHCAGYFNINCIQILLFNFYCILEERRMKKISYSAITQLYINNNLLQVLPCDFFLAFPSLKWLDLRNNKLETLFGPDSYFYSKVRKFLRLFSTY